MRLVDIDIKTIQNTPIIHRRHILDDNKSGLVSTGDDKNIDTDAELVKRPMINGFDDTTNRLLPTAYQLNASNTDDNLNPNAYLKYCFNPEPTGDRVWKVKVLGVCTDEGPLLDNWITSLESNGYDHVVVGLGEKWGGWSWRTKQYIKTLATQTEERLYVLTDATDLFFIGPPNELIYNFRTYDSDIVIGAERAPSTGPLRHDFSLKSEIISFAQSRNTSTRYLVPNGGFVMGFRTPLLNLLCGNANEADDQHGYLTTWLEHPDAFKLDIYARLVANVVYDTPFMTDDDERIESEYFELKHINVDDNEEGKEVLRVVSVETGSRPCAMHFPGKNSQAYNHYGRGIYGNSFNEMRIDNLGYKDSFNNIVKKSWTSPIKGTLWGLF